MLVMFDVHVHVWYNSLASVEAAQETCQQVARFWGSKVVRHYDEPAIGIL